ncbi:MAG: 23S rRNA pseudouridine2457 synthase [Oleiphilaceae bacterium]|jgi:23S rRNA pseudouridine2457 synthase
MADLYLFNKPFNVLSQFTDSDDRSTLADYIKTPSIYPAGRLDYDSEGLLILTSDGELQARIADPKHKLPKTYWVQVEGQIDTVALTKLEKGVLLNDGPTRTAKAKLMNEPEPWPRNPPIRYRKDDITSWLELTITEGRNRQVRRMTAEVGFPTLRLIRYSIGSWSVKDLKQGSYIKLEVNLPKNNINKKKQKINPKRNIKRKY